VNGTSGHRLKGFVGPRDLEKYPKDDDALGMKLFAAVEGALARGRPAPAAFILFDGQIDRFSLRKMGALSPGSQQRILAAMAAQESVECMAVLGAFRFRGQGPLNGAWVVSVFIEWPDNRWWTAWQPLGPTRALVGDAPQVRCALDGSPRPGGVGGWFALGRRKGLKLRVQREDTPVH
jgi:hypothetical protein